MRACVCVDVWGVLEVGVSAHTYARGFTRVLGRACVCVIAVMFIGGWGRDLCDGWQWLT